MNISMIRSWLGLGPAMAAPNRIVRFYHMGREKELFLIGVPFSGGQVNVLVQESEKSSVFTQRVVYNLNYFKQVRRRLL